MQGTAGHEHPFNAMDILLLDLKREVLHPKAPPVCSMCVHTLSVPQTANSNFFTHVPCISPYFKML